MNRHGISGLVALVIAGACVFATPASAIGTVDQQYTIDASSGNLVYGLSQKGQVFTAGRTGLLDQVDFNVQNYGTSVQDLTMTIRGTTSGLPTGSPLATVSVPRSATQNATTWVSFVLPTPLEVVAGTQYAIILSTAETSVNDGYGWTVGFTNLYAGGDSVYSSDDGSTWQVDDSLSQDFITYVTTTSSDAPPPPVLQQFGMPSSGTCDAAAPVMLNWGGAGSGGWGNSWAQWANGGNGGAVCTRTLVYSNAVSHWLVD